jgi:Tfp pilus assembly protein PilE
MKNATGFTVIEMLAMIILLGLVGTVSYSLYDSYHMTHRDQQRKIAINTIHANLQEVVHPKLGAYPRTLDSKQLTALNPKLLKDPAGVPIGTLGSDYRYDPTGCNGGELCTGYTLTANLEREADFIKYGR